MKRVPGASPALSTISCDVAVVGYGPTGMTLAALLGSRGHRVLVLDRYAGLYNLPRAACFDDEIMRVFQRLGIVEEVLPGTVVQTDYEWVNGAGQTLLEISYDDPAPAGWPALYMMYQPHLETVLDGLCRSLPSVEVRQGTTVDGLEHDVDGARLTAAVLGGERISVEARFVVGADGGAGFVRPALGIGQSDYAFSENWLVCDFAMRRPVDSLPSFRQVCDPAQPIAIVRIGPSHHRFSFMLDRDESTARATDPDRIWERVSGYLSREDADLIRAANYVFRSRIADAWRLGPVLLAGDAAHEMPPFLAQGMCSGIRDSHNLAWKLDLILRGLAGTTLLDSYQPEREPHVRFITERAIELGRVQTLRDPEAARSRDERMIAERARAQVPPKIVYPGLSAGLVSATAHAGERMPQGAVGHAGEAARFDDVVGAGPMVIARDAGLVAVLDEAARAAWAELGGMIAVVADPGAEPPAGGEAGVVVLDDAGGTYGAWFGARGCEVALVRPDWYVYGTADTASGLARLLDEYRAGLGAAPISPASA
jgi:2-polyprenyl-6-methoxyphenol hydroxylase-like FAD-dependent oxidoreductase